MERWRAPTVLAWLEVALGMPQYGARCAENVKSGKVINHVCSEKYKLTTTCGSVFSNAFYSCKALEVNVYIPGKEIQRGV